MSRSTTVDVLVVGAGPAGVAAALAAHRRGLSTLAVDRVTFPRDKTCGDGLTAGALRAYEQLGFDPSALAEYEPVSTAMLRSPSTRVVALPLPRDGEFAGVVTRAALDSAFVDHARARGIEVRDGVGMTDGEGDREQVTAVLDDGSTLRSRFVIAADGHYSPVRRIFDPHRRADIGTWHAQRQYFTGVEDPRLWVLFEPDLLPGYAWVFPLPDRRANVGFGVRRAPATHGRQLAAHWRALLDSPTLRAVVGSNAKAEGAPRAWPIPTGYRPDALTSGRVLFAGDAARVVDPMTGEGIAQALTTGVLAAEAIAAGGDTTAVGVRYRHTVDRALGTDLRFADVLGTILRSPRGARFAVRAAGMSGWTRRNFARWMFEDYPRAILLTPGRWHRRMLHGGGAYRR